MKILLALILIASTHLSHSQNLNLYRVEKTQIDLNELYDSMVCSDSSIILEIPGFECSPLITWKEYNLFLSWCQRHRGEELKNKMLPELPNIVLNKGLTSPKYKDLPVPGVSWINANYFAQWKSIQDNDSKLKFCYRLVNLAEYEAIRQSSEQKELINTNYGEWTSTSKDESVYSFVNCRDYLTFGWPARYNDTPALKRKKVVENSFLRSYSETSECKHSYYQDSGYVHVGFRLIKEYRKDLTIDQYAEWLPDSYDKFEAYSQSRKLKLNEQELQFDNQKVVYSTVNGKLHGRYCSYHSNGKQKSSGLYTKNQRVGNWMCWDSAGNLITERNYSSDLTYEVKTPIPSDDQAKILLNSTKYFPQKNDRDFYQYSHLQERQVLWSQRRWCEILPNNNPYFFNKFRLYQTIIEAALTDNIKVYDTLTDQFTHVLSSDLLNKRIPENYSIQKFLIKEDVFFDLDRMLMETRIIGICPVLLDSNKLDQGAFKLAWFYYPEMRPILAAEKIEENRMKLKPQDFPQGHLMKSLDDLFFERNFDWTVYKISNFKNQPLPDPLENKWQNRISAIEVEHDIWIKSYHR